MVNCIFIKGCELETHYCCFAVKMAPRNVIMGKLTPIIRRIPTSWTRHTSYTIHRMSVYKEEKNNKNCTKITSVNKCLSTMDRQLKYTVYVSSKDSDITKMCRQYVTCRSTYR